MKKIIRFCPYIIALLPQFFIQDYLWYMIVMLLIGFVSRYIIQPKKVLLTMFLIELVVFSIILLVFNDRIFYLKGVFENLALPTILSPIIFLLFNAVNVAVLYFTGYTLGRLISAKDVVVSKE